MALLISKINRVMHRYSIEGRRNDTQTGYISLDFINYDLHVRYNFPSSILSLIF